MVLLPNLISFILKVSFSVLIIGMPNLCIATSIARFSAMLILLLNSLLAAENVLLSLAYPLIIFKPLMAILRTLSILFSCLRARKYVPKNVPISAPIAPANNEIKMSFIFDDFRIKN